MRHLLIVLALLPIGLVAQDFNRIEMDEHYGKDILIGYCTLDVFQEDLCSGWFNFEYDSYEVDTETLEDIKTLELENVSIKLVLGTWCSDSQREVPRLIKILNDLDFNMQQMEIICVNSKKEAELTNVFELEIEYVPTIIIYKDKIEIGRIIEAPAESIEKDLVNILNI